MNKSQRKVYFFYESKEKIFYMEDGTDKILETTKQNKANIEANFFELSENYEPNKESLIKYMNDYNKCNEEILKFTNGRLNYKIYYNHILAAKNVFKSKSTNIMKKLNIQNISVMECSIFEMHYNAGMLYLKKDIIKKKIKCFGYDFKNCYASFLVEDFLDIPLCISSKQGTIKEFDGDIDITNIETLEKLAYGSYNIIITSEHPTIKQFFQFSPEHWYTIFDLFKLHKLVKYLFETEKDPLLQKFVKMSSVKQCLVYEKENLIKCKDIFQDWFNYVGNIKNNLPKNMLAKNLNKSLWGALSQFDRIYVESKDINEYDFLYPEDVDEDRKPEYICIKVYTGNKKYELVKAKNPYKEGGIARLKIYLVSAIRYYITNMLIKCNLLTDVIRICTDGIVLNREFDFQKCGLKYVPIKEDKTTGKIKFYDANKYRSICKTCKCEYNFKKGHICG